MKPAYHERDNGINTYVMDFGEKITFVSTLGERLMNAREAKGLTQQQLATAAGVSQGTIGNIESGARKRPRELLKIARALEVDPDWLETGKYPAMKVVPHVAEHAPPAAAEPWPFAKITRDQIARLDDATRLRLEDQMIGFLAACEALSQTAATA